MLASTIIGLGCVVLGMISLLVDLNGFLEIQIGGEPVRTTEQKLLFTVVAAGLAFTGIRFWCLWMRGYTLRAVLVCVLLLTLILLVAWTTGRGDLLSVGGATH
jgi:hypothetical protein